LRGAGLSFNGAGLMLIALPTPLPRAVLILLLVSIGIIWGGTFGLARTGGAGGIPTLGYAFWFHLGGGLGLLAVALAQRSRVTPSWQLLFYTLIGGLSVNAVPSFFMFTAVRHIPTGIMAVIITLAPVVTYVTSLALRYERFVLTRALGTLAGLGGVALILLPRASLPEPGLIGWVLLALICPLSHGTGSIYVARARPAGIDSWMVGALFQLASAAFVLPFALATGQFHILGSARLSGEIAMWVHAGTGVLTQFLMYEILRLAGAVFMSQVAYIVTVAGIFWGWLLFGEHLSAWIWLAAAVIAAGVVLVTRPAPRAV